VICKLPGRHPTLRSGFLEEEKKEKRSEHLIVAHGFESGRGEEQNMFLALFVFGKSECAMLNDEVECRRKREKNLYSNDRRRQSKHTHFGPQTWSRSIVFSNRQTHSEHTTDRQLVRESQIRQQEQEHSLLPGTILETIIGQIRKSERTGILIIFGCAHILREERTSKPSGCVLSVV